MGNKIELILFLIIIGSSAISWIVRQLKEKAEIRRRQMELERRRLEALRTGRNLETVEDAQVSVGPATLPGPASAPTAPATSPEERLRQLMIERQRRIEELRRRQAQAQSQGTPAAPSQPGRLILGPDGEVRPANRPTAPAQRRQQPQQPRPSHAEQRRQQKAAQQQQGARRVAQQRKAEERAAAERAAAAEAVRAETIRQQNARDLADQVRAGVVPAGPRAAAAPGSPASGPVLDPRTITRDELRRAVILTEIFGPPVSERESA